MIKRKPRWQLDSLAERNQSKLSLAAKRGDREEVEQLLCQSEESHDEPDHNGRTALSFAAEFGHEAIVQLLLDLGHADPDTVDNSGRTPLSRAAERGQENVVRLLMDRPDVNPNVQDCQGWTPLRWAIQHLGEVKYNWYPRKIPAPVVQLLLSYASVNPNVQCDIGQTVLLRAVERKLPRTVEQLLKHDRVDRNLMDDAGDTALCRAVDSGHIEMVGQLLEDQHIDAEHKNGTGQTVLSRSAQFGNLKMVNELLKCGRVDPNSADDNGRTPLLQAVKQGYEQIARTILKVGRVTLQTQDNHGRTVLSHAAEVGLLTLVEELLKNDHVDPDEVDDEGRTPLSYAAEHDHAEVASALISCGVVDLNHKDHIGRTPLSRAVAFTKMTESSDWTDLGRFKTARLLLSQEGIDPNAQDIHGSTPLIWATKSPPKIEKEVPAVFEYLLEREDITANLCDNEGRTPLSTAAEHGQKSILVRLLQVRDVAPDGHDYVGRTALSYAAGYGRLDIVEVLLRQSAVRPNSKDYLGRTPLWWAAKGGHEGVIDILLQRREVDPECVDSTGLTPLACAIQHGQENKVGSLLNRDRATMVNFVRDKSQTSLQALIHCGSNINIKDIRGRTPLHTAVNLGYATIAQELINGGAIIDIKDNNGKRPLHLALQHKYENIIALLLKNMAQAEGIASSTWLEAFNQIESATVLLMTQLSSGMTVVSFSQDTMASSFHRSEDENSKRLMVYPSFLSWSNSVNWTHPDIEEADAAHFSHEVQTYASHDTITIVALFPDYQLPKDQGRSGYSKWKQYGIAWTMVPSSEAVNGLTWVSTDYFSTLSNGWIPRNGSEFFVLFIRKLKENWLVLCAAAEERLAKRRLEQLRAKGTTISLIDHLSADAQAWAELRSVLRGQIKSAKAFVDIHCRSYDQDEGQSTMQAAIDEFAAEVNEQIASSDKTVKELLQFEFAWVSINEAHRSTSIATSIKRLSWITFIFLPAMFASSLFGMNVDILESNPDWRWYLLFGGGFVALTVLVWLVFKYGKIETSVEQYFIRRCQRLSVNMPDFGSRFKGDISTLPK